VREQELGVEPRRLRPLCREVVRRCAEHVAER
jgi:hypothetical protein